MKEKIYALKQSAYYGALNGTLAATLLGGVVLAFCLVSVSSTHVGQSINWYALVIEAIVLVALIAHLVKSQDWERAPFTDSIQYCSVWVLAWVLTAAVVFTALSMVAMAMTAIALAQSWFTMKALIITGIASGIVFVWCLFMHLCPEPAQVL